MNRIAEIRERTAYNGLPEECGGPGPLVTLTPEERDWLCSQLEEAREVMREIAESYYKRIPLPEEWAKEVAACEECTRRRNNVHFPTNWCNDHYCQMAAHNEREKRSEANHDITLRQMARRWLEGE